MISVEQARDIISSNLKVLQPVNMPLAAAFNHVLAEDVFSTTDVSPFPQSAMDGYAFRFEDILHHKPLFMEGKIAAGSPGEKLLKLQQAMRICTGAPLPSNADTMPLIAQESYKLSSFAIADCLIVLEEDKTTFNTGDIVEIHLLPQ